jgi:hypothetical protein
MTRYLVTKNGENVYDGEDFGDAVRSFPSSPDYGDECRKYEIAKYKEDIVTLDYKLYNGATQKGLLMFIPISDLENLISALKEAAEEEVTPQ